jgi:hypothetical protein
MSKFLVTVIERVRVLYEVEAESAEDIYAVPSIIGHEAKQLSSIFDGWDIEEVKESD